MIFEDDLRIEEEGYNKVIRPYLQSIGLDSVFIRYSSKQQNVLFNYFNKTRDIDFITDTGKTNYTISLKVVQHIYNQIFFETVKNTFTQAKGWAYYSQADYLFYLMLDEGQHSNFKLIITDFKLLRNLDLSSYKTAFGKTTSKSGKLLYKTEGKLIPLKDFKHKVINRIETRDEVILK